MAKTIIALSLLALSGCASTGATYLVDESTTRACPAGQMHICQTLGGIEKCACERQQRPSDIFR